MATSRTRSGSHEAHHARQQGHHEADGEEHDIEQSGTQNHHPPALAGVPDAETDSRDGNQADRPDAVSRYFVYSSASSLNPGPFSPRAPGMHRHRVEANVRQRLPQFRQGARHVIGGGHHDQGADAVLLRPGGGLHAVAAGRGGIAAQRDPIGEARRVDPREAAQRGEVGAAADAAEQQLVGPAARQQVQGQFHPPRPAGQGDDPVGVRWRRFGRPAA